jgi:hypothetical protein
MNNQDPRHHPRVTGTAGVELRSKSGQVVCRPRDLSLAGCYVETRVAPEADEVELLLHIPGQRGRVAFPARVVRRDKRHDGMLGLALQFLAMDWSALLGLARIVSPQLV